MLFFTQNMSNSKEKKKFWRFHLLKHSLQNKRNTNTFSKGNCIYFSAYVTKIHVVFYGIITVTNCKSILRLTSVDNVPLIRWQRSRILQTLCGPQELFQTVHMQHGQAHELQETKSMKLQKAIGYPQRFSISRKVIHNSSKGN